MVGKPTNNTGRMAFHSHIAINANKKHAGTTIINPMTINQNASQKLKKVFFISYQIKFPHQVASPLRSSIDIAYRELLIQL